MRLLLSSFLLAGCAGDPVSLPGDDPDGRVDCASVASGHICTLAGTGERGWSADGGPAWDSTLFLPTDVALDSDGQPLIVDYNNMRVLRLETEGTLQTVIGVGVHAYATDGIDPLETPLENPVSLEVGSDGAWYVTEQHGARVLRVADGWLDVYAGSPDDPGAEDWTGDGGPAREARMSQSVGLAIADDDTLFIADTGNRCVRLVTPDGTMQALAGSGEDALVDGVGDAASLSMPQHMAWHDGFVYVADTGNHAVRRIEVETGEVLTVAGTGAPGFSGDGGPAAAAQLDTPQGVGVDADGRVYIADSENHVIRRVETDGTITTWAGTPGVPGYDGDGGPADAALLQWPLNVRVGPDGTVYIADTLNSVIREVAP